MLKEPGDELSSLSTVPLGAVLAAVAFCGTSIAGVDGERSIQIGSATCKIEDGDTISFTLNGDAVVETAAFSTPGWTVAGERHATIGMTLTAKAPVPARGLARLLSSRRTLRARG